MVCFSSHVYLFVLFIFFKASFVNITSKSVLTISNSVVLGSSIHIQAGFLLNISNTQVVSLNNETTHVNCLNSIQGTQLSDFCSKPLSRLRLNIKDNIVLKAQDMHIAGNSIVSASGIFLCSRNITIHTVARVTSTGKGCIPNQGINTGSVLTDAAVVNASKSSLNNVASSLSLGGSNGGFVFVHSLHSMTLHGVISSNGSVSTGMMNGGSGGLISVFASYFTGSGSFLVGGASSSESGTGGGSGGIVVLNNTYPESRFGQKFKGRFGLVGGKGFSSNGIDGSVWLPVCPPGICKEKNVFLYIT